MSAKEKSSDLDLMAHYDGELDDAGLRDSIAGDAPSRAKLEALGQISEVVRTTVELEVDAVIERADPFAAMWSRIERQINANGVHEEAAQGTTAPAPAEPAGVWASITAWFERYRTQLATGAMCAVAAAALVWFLRPPETTVEYVEVPGAAVKTERAQVVPASLDSQPPEVESLEIYDGSGAVFTIAGEDGETAVIWLSSPEETVEGPI